MKSMNLNDSNFGDSKVVINRHKVAVCGAVPRFEGVPLRPLSVNDNVRLTPDYDRIEPASGSMIDPPGATVLAFFEAVYRGPACGTNATSFKLALVRSSTSSESFDYAAVRAVCAPLLLFTAFYSYEAMVATATEVSTEDGLVYGVVPLPYVPRRPWHFLRRAGGARVVLPVF